MNGIRNVLKDRPDITHKQLTRTRDLMNSHVRDCLVTGHKKIIPTLTLPDKNDLHVLAAAIKSSASHIITFNLKDFPQSHIQAYGIKAQHPDMFLENILDLSPMVFCAATQRLRTSLKNPPIGPEEYLEILKRQSLHKTTERLQSLIKII